MSALKEQILKLFSERSHPIAITDIRLACRPEGVDAVATALDQLVIDDLIVQTSGKNGYVYSASSTQASAQMEPRPRSDIRRQRVSALGSNTCIDRDKLAILSDLALRTDPASGPEIYTALNISQTRFSAATPDLIASGTISRTGDGNKPRYALGPAVAAASENESPPAANSDCGVAPIETNIDGSSHTAVTSRSVSEPAAPCAAGEVRTQHEGRSEAGMEALRRQAIAEAIAEDRVEAQAYGDLNDLVDLHERAFDVAKALPSDHLAAIGDHLFRCIRQDLKMPQAMRNDAALGPAALRSDDDDFAVATAIHIDAGGNYALWSDGHLEIESGDDFISLSPTATRELAAYLARVGAIDP